MSRGWQSCRSRLVSVQFLFLSLNSHGLHQQPECLYMSRKYKHLSDNSSP